MWDCVEKIMQQKGLRITDLQKGTGVPYSTFTDWKAGRYTPKSDKLQKVADFLGVSVEYLQTGKFPKRSSTTGGSFYFSDDAARLAQRLTANSKLYDLVDAFEKLNDEGQDLVCSMVSGLVGNPAYISGKKRRSSSSVTA